MTAMSGMPPPLSPKDHGWEQDGFVLKPCAVTPGTKLAHDEILQWYGVGVKSRLVRVQFVSVASSVAPCFVPVKPIHCVSTHWPRDQRYQMMVKLSVMMKAMMRMVNKP